MEEVYVQQQQHERTYRDIHQSSKNKHSSSLEKLQQRTAPSFMAAKARVSTTKTSVYESRTCKELMTDKFNRVGISLLPLLNQGSFLLYRLFCLSMA